MFFIINSSLLGREEFLSPIKNADFALFSDALPFDFLERDIVSLTNFSCMI